LKKLLVVALIVCSVGTAAYGSWYHIEASRPKPIAVPMVSGISLRDADAQLANLGLGISVSSQIYDKTPLNTVITSNPSAGAVLAPGATVSVIVSKGPIPKLIPKPSPTRTVLVNPGEDSFGGATVVRAW